MNRFGFVPGLAILLLLGLASPARAESEVEMLRREVRELKNTVQQLTQIVREQDRRLDRLAPETAPATATTPAKPAEPPAPTAAAAAKTDGGPGGDAEVSALLDTVNSAPPSPGSDSRSIGLWRYPSGGGGAAKLLPDISFIPSFGVGYFSQDPTGDVGHDPARTGFTLQEIEMAISSAIDPYFRFDIALSFLEDGVELEEGYFTTLGAGLPRGLQFRGGKILLPFGRQNPKHLHQWAFADNNLVNKLLLGPEGLGELGLEMSYLFPTPIFLQLQGGFYNGDNDTSFGGTRKQDFLYNARLATSVDINQELTALIGSSLAFGFNDTGPGNRTDLVGGDFLLKWKPSARTSVAWQTEYILRRMQFPGFLASDGGLYSYVDVQFLKQWHAALRYDQVGVPQGVVAREFRLTPAISFDPTEFSRIRLQYEFDKVANADPVHSMFLQFQFSLGPHGVHPF